MTTSWVASARQNVTQKSKPEQNTFDSIGNKSKIPEENNEFQLNRTENQSRNFSIFEGKMSEGDYTYSKQYRNKQKNLKKLEFYPDKISEYSAKTPS